jgi:hypothetical protein
MLRTGSSSIIVGIDFQSPHILILAPEVTWEMVGLNFGHDVDYFEVFRGFPQSYWVNVGEG